VMIIIIEILHKIISARNVMSSAKSASIFYKSYNNLKLKYIYYYNLHFKRGINKNQCAECYDNLVPVNGVCRCQPGIIFKFRIKFISEKFNCYLKKCLNYLN
jgi:hypothetical protein